MEASLVPSPVRLVQRRVAVRRWGGYCRRAGGAATTCELRQRHWSRTDAAKFKRAKAAVKKRKDREARDAQHNAGAADAAPAAAAPPRKRPLPVVAVPPPAPPVATAPQPVAVREEAAALGPGRFTLSVRLPPDPAVAPHVTAKERAAGWATAAVPVLVGEPTPQPPLMLSMPRPVDAVAGLWAGLALASLGFTLRFVLAGLAASRRAHQSAAAEEAEEAEELGLFDAQAHQLQVGRGSVTIPAWQPPERRAVNAIRARELQLKSRAKQRMLLFGGRREQPVTAEKAEKDAAAFKAWKASWEKQVGKSVEEVAKASCGYGRAQRFTAADKVSRSTSVRPPPTPKQSGLSQQQVVLAALTSPGLLPVVMEKPEELRDLLQAQPANGSVRADKPAGRAR